MPRSLDAVPPAARCASPLCVRILGRASAPASTPGSAPAANSSATSPFSGACCCRSFIGADEINAMFVPRTPAERRRYFDEVWNNRRWRALYRLFFSRAVMARIGRDPSFFRYVEDDVGPAMAARVERGLTEGDPATNPYLHWFAFGRYGIPAASRLAAGELRLDSRPRWTGSSFVCNPSRRRSPRHRTPASIGSTSRTCFEYVSPAAATQVFEMISRCGSAGGRVAYWNMMVAREAAGAPRGPAAAPGRREPHVPSPGGDLFLSRIPGRRDRGTRR